jgi:hypothetical protein
MIMYKKSEYENKKERKKERTTPWVIQFTATDRIEYEGNVRRHNMQQTKSLWPAGHLKQTVRLRVLK